MIIDAHSHYEPKLKSESEILELMEKHGIEKTILLPLLTIPPEPAKPSFLMSIQRKLFYFNFLRPLGIKLTKLMYKSKGEWNLGLFKYFISSKNTNLEIVQKPDNAMVISMIDRNPDKFLGWLFLNPSKKSSIEELEKWGKHKGVIGVKLHPFWHWYGLNEIDAFLEKVEELGLPINVHLGFDSAGLIDSFRKFKKLKVIFSHLGVPYYKKIWPEIKANDLWFMDTSSTYHVDEFILKKAVAVVGVEKIIFASDTPYTREGSIGELLSWIDNLNISGIEKEKMLSSNILRVINWKQK